MRYYVQFDKQGYADGTSPCEAQANAAKGLIEAVVKVRHEPDPVQALNEVGFSVSVKLR